jgi:hypothetical protein
MLGNFEIMKKNCLIIPPNNILKFRNFRVLHSTLSNIKYGWGDSRSNEGKALSVLATREGFAIVLLSTGGNGAKLGHIDEGLHEGILLTG